MRLIGRTKIQTAFFCAFLCLIWLGLAGSECRSEGETATADTSKTTPSVPKTEDSKDNSQPKTLTENPKKTTAPEIKPVAKPSEKQKDTAVPTTTEKAAKAAANTPKTVENPADPNEIKPPEKSDTKNISPAPEKPEEEKTPPTPQPKPAEKPKDTTKPKTDTPKTKTEDKPAKTPPTETPASDPNSVSSPADPNAIKPSDDKEDVFSPKLSTLIKINEAFETIFSSEFVSEKGLVDYAKLRRKRSTLLNLAKDLDNVNPMILMSLSPKEKTAFWINTHNACILKLIVDYYPIQHKPYMIFYPNNSIMQITGDWRTKHFFDVQGFQYKLEEIEQEFLMDRTKDPRILFALSYASIGGANLRNEPYTAEKMDEQLDDQVRKYLKSEQGMKIDRDKNTLYLSNLFTMYKHKEMFLASEYAKILRFRDHKPEVQAWLNFIRDYLSEEDIRFLEEGDYKIKFIKYDWELDEGK